MSVVYLCFLLGVVVVAACGVLIYRTTPTDATSIQDVLGRLGRVRDECVDELGRHIGALAVLLAGAAAAVIVPWPFGRLVRRFKPQIDAPILRWTQRHTTTSGSWHHINTILTQVGNRPTIKVVTLVMAVVFAVLWRNREWWIPPLALAAAFGFEKFGALALGKVVDRPAVDLPHFGGFPSGGCARLIITYGIIVYLALLTWPSLGRRWRVGGFTVVAVMAWIEAYTRIYLIKHWAMDVVAGLLYGTLMLLALIAATSCFKLEPSREPQPDRREAVAAR